MYKNKYSSVSYRVLPFPMGSEGSCSTRAICTWNEKHPTLKAKFAIRLHMYPALILFEQPRVE
jgi:hypothetical protein